MEYKERLPSEKEEIESLKRYMGFKHTQINMLVDLNPKEITNLKLKGWDFNISSKDLEKLIKDFVNIYGMIYAEGNNKGHNRLYRGTTKEWIENSKNSGVISTSLDEDIAKTFGDGILVRINVERGLSCLNIEPYRDDNTKDEAEVLILPFSQVKKNKFSSNFNNYSYYDISLGKEDLPELTDRKLENLTEKCKKNFDNFMTQLNIYCKLSEEELTLLERLKQETIGEKIRTYREEQDNIIDERRKIAKEINQYRKELNTLLKALCKQRELDKDKKKKEDLKEEKKKQLQLQKEEKKEQSELLEKEIVKKKKEIKKDTENIKEQLEIYIDTFNTNINRYIKFAENLGVKIFNNKNIREELESKFRKIIEELDKTEEIKTRKNGNKEKEYSKIKERKENIEEVKKLLEQIPEMVEKYEEASVNNIKAGLNMMVQDLIYKDECFGLEMERRKVLDEKETIFQRLLVRNDLKDEKLFNIEQRIKLAYLQKQLRNPNNDINEMLKEIYECAYKYYDGNLTIEMEGMVSLIRDRHSGLKEEQYIRMEAEPAAKTKSLAIIEKKNKSKIFGLFNKKEVKKVKQDTAQVQSDIKQAEEELLEINKFGNSPMSNIYIDMQNLLDNMYNNIKSQDSEKNTEKEERIA